MRKIKLSTIFKELESDGIDTTELRTFNPNTREGLSDLSWYNIEHPELKYSIHWRELDEYVERQLAVITANEI